MLIVLGLVQAALQRRKHPFERLIHAAPGKDKVVIKSVHQLLAEGRRKLLVRSGKAHLVLLRYLLKKRIVVHDGVVPGAAPRMNTLAQGKSLIRDDKILIEIVYRSEPAAFRTRSERRVEGKRARFQFIKGDSAMLARVQFRIRSLDRLRGTVAAFRQLLDVDYSMSGLETKLHGVRETRPVARQDDAVHDNVDIMALLLVQLRQFIDRKHRAVDADTGEALPFDLGKRLLMPPFLALHDGSVKDYFKFRVVS